MGFQVFVYLFIISISVSRFFLPHWISQWPHTYHTWDPVDKQPIFAEGGREGRKEGGKEGRRGGREGNEK